jgi:sulfatase modifying factor 1
MLNAIVCTAAGLYLPQAKAQAPQGFVKIPAGIYTIGSKGHQQNPRRTMRTKTFYIRATEVTNREFAAFIKATGYITDAERNKRAMVFEPGLKEFEWLQDSTACWRYPNGVSRGGIDHKMEHPVVTISFADAVAYCAWSGMRLPSLSEWEIAARAGSTEQYFWGSDPSGISRYANVWQGRDHRTANTNDGFIYTAPVGQFAPNAWGLYDVFGNVFEFCTGSLPQDKGHADRVHARGGSWWCSRNSCNFYNAVDIGSVLRHASFSNQGFRVVVDVLPTGASVPSGQ